MIGPLNTKSYNYDNIFVDQALRLVYVYIQKTNNEIETLEAKSVIQQPIMNRGVILKDCHADNDIFKVYDLQQAWKMRERSSHLQE